MVDKSQGACVLSACVTLMGRIDGASGSGSSCACVLWMLLPSLPSSFIDAAEPAQPAATSHGMWCPVRSHLAPLDLVHRRPWLITDGCLDGRLQVVAVAEWLGGIGC